MKKPALLRWLPLITFLLIIPCGLDTPVCLPFIFIIPIALLAGDVNTILPIIGIFLILINNPYQTITKKIIHLLGVAILLVTVFKIPHDAGNSFKYVWDSTLSYSTIILFLVCSIISCLLIIFSKIRVNNNHESPI